MKGMKNLLAGAFAALMLVSCGGGKSPESAAKDFLNAVKSGDKAKYEALSTQATKDMLSKKPLEISDVKDLKTTSQTDSSATVSYCCEKGKTEASSLTLTKADGKWLVDMKKEQSLENSMESALQEGMGELGAAADSLKEGAEAVEGAAQKVEEAAKGAAEHK